MYMIDIDSTGHEYAWSDVKFALSLLPSHAPVQVGSVELNIVSFVDCSLIIFFPYAAKMGMGQATESQKTSHSK